MTDQRQSVEDIVTEELRIYEDNTLPPEEKLHVVWTDTGAKIYLYEDEKRFLFQGWLDDQAIFAEERCD